MKKSYFVILIGLILTAMSFSLVLAQSGDDNEDDGDGAKETSAYCSGKKETPHPAALFLHQTLGKDIDEIMMYFCDGFGFGQIALAIQTETISDDVDDYGDLLLEKREQGKGWGQIWDELGYKGKPKDTDWTPPGQDKDKDKEDKEDKVKKDKEDKEDKDKEDKEDKVKDKEDKEDKVKKDKDKDKDK